MNFGVQKTDHSMMNNGYPKISGLNPGTCEYSIVNLYYIKHYIVKFSTWD